MKDEETHFICNCILTANQYFILCFYDNQLKEIEQSCIDSSGVLLLDTTFDLTDMWLTKHKMCEMSKKKSQVNPRGALVTSDQQFEEAVQRSTEKEKPNKSRKTKKSDKETTRTCEKGKAKSASEEEEDIEEIPVKSDYDSEEQFF